MHGQQNIKCSSGLLHSRWW